MGLFDDISARHERLKHRIHNFRIPLSRKGQIAMNFVYFIVPVTSGHYLMQWINGRAEQNLKDAGVVPHSYGKNIPGVEEEDGPYVKELTKVNKHTFRKLDRRAEGIDEE